MVHLMTLTFPGASFKIIFLGGDSNLQKFEGVTLNFVKIVEKKEKNRPEDDSDKSSISPILCA